LDDVASNSHKKLPAGYILFFSSECWRNYFLALGSYSWALLSSACLESEVLFSLRYTCCSNTTWWRTTRAAGLAENCGCHNVACILTWGWEEVKPCAGLPQVGLQLSHLLCCCRDQDRREESTFPPCTGILNFQWNVNADPWVGIMQVVWIFGIKKSKFPCYSPPQIPFQDWKVIQLTVIGLDSDMHYLPKTWGKPYSETTLLWFFCRMFWSWIIMQVVMLSFC
jgi:hypothetical protein